MKIRGKALIILAFSLICGLVSPAQTRQPAVAGAFYPEKAEQLFSMLQTFFPKESNPPTRSPQALIVPHAGYAYSGTVAARAYQQIPPGSQFERIFIIGASHTKSYPGASTYLPGNYLTPFGEVEVDTVVAASLIRQNPLFSFRPSAHIREHSLEVQLPMLQFRLANEFKIVPILLGQVNSAEIRSIAQTLRPWFNEKNLFIISSDFSHYPDYQNARLSDSLCAKAILKNSPDELRQTLTLIEEAKIPNLITPMCGRTAILALLELSQGQTDLQMEHLLYRNSGQVKIGDPSRVVGYHAFALRRRIFTEAHGKILVQIARASLKMWLETSKKPQFDHQALAGKLDMPGGIFVSIYKEGQLRGCIGRLISDQPVYQTTADMTLAAASEDHRFPPVRLEELDQVQLEVSVLTPLQRISNTSRIEIGKHGIYLVKGRKTGTFLPKVAVDQGWDALEFLSQCAAQKAGIGRDGWREGTEIYIYEARVFRE